jgi:hypothetical protein
MEMVSKSPAVQMIEQFRAWLERNGVKHGTQAEVDAVINADHAEALREDAHRGDEWASFKQNRAWFERHELVSGRREHVNAAIEIDHAEALLMNQVSDDKLPMTGVWYRRIGDISVLGKVTSLNAPVVGMATSAGAWVGSIERFAAEWEMS